MRRLLCLLFLFSPLAFSAERLWFSDLDSTRWLFSGDNNRCELTYWIDGFGNVNFVAEPGVSVSVEIQPTSGDKVKSLMSVESIAPPWHADVAGPLTYAGKTQARLDGGLSLNKAQPIYDALSHGDWIWLSLQGREGDIQSLQITNVNFSVAAEAFNACRAQLLPISYGTARNTVLNFANGAFEVDAGNAKDLASIAELIASDSTINKVLIDGYAGDYSDRSANLRLSQSRAEEVASLLVESGVPLSKLEIRWHGDRYIVTEEQQSDKKRYVTVRLIKKIVSGDS